MALERQIGGGGGVAGLRGLVERANAVVRAIAQPSLTQLVLRFALAVPFWRSGVNKWDGFLQLNDVAVLLFSSEFKLHLPGGPYHFPAPGVDGVRRRLGGNPAADPPRPRPGDALRRARASRR